MRTKTLLLTAALTAAGIASSMAQVYSVNLVGYINKTVPSGFYMLANQLNNGTGNKVKDLIPNPQDGTYVYKFNPSNGGYVINDYLGGWEGDEPDTMTLAPGEGVFISSPSQQTVTFVGEVVLDSTITYNAGFSIISSVIPQNAPLDTMSFAPVDGDYIYQFNPSNGGYIINDYLGGWEGDNNGAAPSPAIGESFFVSHPAGPVGTWTRHFTVN